MNIGYARVSSADQKTDLQIDALKKAGCERILRDEGISGNKKARPGLNRALKILKPGDVLIVWRLDRLGRSLSHLIEIINELFSRKIGFKSLSESIDTTTAQGRLIFHVMGALAEFERGLIVERTYAGVVAARARGVRFGRKAILSQKQIEHAQLLISNGEPVRHVMQTLGVSRSTLYRNLEQLRIKKAMFHVEHPAVPGAISYRFYPPQQIESQK
jgi:DNA invertase Pin-like site-specific DNA recombinase